MNEILKRGELNDVAACRFLMGQALERGAPAQGYTGDFWTLGRIGQLIRQLFEVRYRPGGVWPRLQRVRWRSQRVQRRSIPRDEGAVAHWRRHVWPQPTNVSDFAQG